VYNIFLFRTNIELFFATVFEYDFVYAN